MAYGITSLFPSSGKLFLTWKTSCADLRLLENNIIRHNCKVTALIEPQAVREPQKASGCSRATSAKVEVKAVLKLFSD